MEPLNEPPKGLNGALSRLVKSFRLRLAERELVGGRSVLDLGCGLCEITPRVPSDVSYVGVERDRWMYGRAVEHFPERSFLCADIEDPAFDPGTGFDRILLIAVWEHLHDPAAFLRRAREWSEPGGKLVLTTPSPLAHTIIDWGARLGLLSSMAAEEHDRLWKIGEVEQVAEAAGWRTVRSGRFLLGLNQIVVLEAENREGMRVEYR